MIREITKDLETLKTVSKPCTVKDASVIKDLLDTAKAHKDDCLGLAAIQISKPIKAFVVKTKEGNFQTFINPMIIAKSPTTYEAEEGCLSLEGRRKVKRHDWIKVMYQTTIGGKTITERTAGLRAEVIQHEYDHLFGKLI